MVRSDHDQEDEKLGRAWQSAPIRRIGRRPWVDRNIGFRIASGWIAGYNRHANRSPSQAVTSGDSQNQPNSPPTLCAVTSRCSTAPASRRCSLQFQLLDRSRTSRRSESERRFPESIQITSPFLALGVDFGLWHLFRRERFDLHCEECAPQDSSTMEAHLLR